LKNTTAHMSELCAKFCKCYRQVFFFFLFLYKDFSFFFSALTFLKVMVLNVKRKHSSFSVSCGWNYSPTQVLLSKHANHHKT
jgi:hypothetical protein